MFSHRADSSIGLKTHFHWFLLRFLAGCINAGGFLAAERFVSHVTGFATLFGIEAAQRRWAEALAMLSVPGYFLAGVMISGWLVERPFQTGARPRYATVMGLVVACLAFAAIGGHFHLFGTFAAAFDVQESYVLLALLCLASGLQNAAITTSSGATVRTTHLTGVTTDLGLGLVKIFSVRRDSPEFAAEAKAIRLRLGKIVFFALGSAVLFFRFEFLGFLFPALIASYVYWVALRTPARAGLRQEINQ